MTTRVDDAIRTVVAVLTEAFADGTAVVVDGPEIRADEPDTVVHVGWDGDHDGDYQATENWTQTWAGGLGRQPPPKDETFDILGAVISGDGDVDVPTRRATALSVLGVVETTLRAAVNTGLGLPQPTVAQFSSGQLFQEQGPNGLQARIPFVISVKTRI